VIFSITIGFEMERFRLGLFKSFCFVIFNRNDIRPQPKPRLSLVKPPNKDTEFIRSQSNGNIVQRIKPFFEQPSIIPAQELKIVKQQRQPISIPYTYQTESATKVTCLDDIISTKV
jgi:hypothetical protein